MKFLIQNTTSENKYITRFGGDKICVPKNDFIEFDSTDALECKYWSNLVYNPIEGLKVITDTTRIRLLNKMKACGKLGNTTNTVTKKDISNKVEPEIVVKEEVIEKPIKKSVKKTTKAVETSVEEVINEKVEEVVEPVVLDKTEEVVTTEETVEVTDTTEETTETNTFTTEELATKTKEELFAILDSLDIKYKKSYSVSRLIDLILDNNK